MQRKVAKQAKRNPFSRFILAKSNKDKIAVWRQDLVRVLQVFNVRPIFLLVACDSVTPFRPWHRKVLPAKTAR
jgi:hypothetical protein